MFHLCNSFSFSTSHRISLFMSLGMHSWKYEYLSISRAVAIRNCLFFSLSSTQESKNEPSLTLRPFQWLEYLLLLLPRSLVLCVFFNPSCTLFTLLVSWEMNEVIVRPSTHRNDTGEEKNIDEIIISVWSQVNHTRSKCFSLSLSHSLLSQVPRVTHCDCCRHANVYAACVLYQRKQCISLRYASIMPVVRQEK